MDKPILHFLDIETTGLDCNKHEIIDITIISIYPDGVSKVFNSLIHPAHIETADPKALEINGYTPLGWSGAMDMDTAAKQIATILVSGYVVGYNPSFDWGFIEAMYNTYQIPLPKRIRLIDVMVLVYEHLVPLGLTSLSLNNTRKFLGWSTVNCHTSLQDTRDTMKLYFLLIRFPWYKKILLKMRNILYKFQGKRL